MATKSKASSPRSRTTAKGATTDTTTVTVSRRPSLRCGITHCGQPLSYDPRETTASAILTDHYNAAHPDVAAALASIP